MPIYEYRCEQCDKVSEFLVAIGDDIAELRCKHCGSKELRRMISSVSVTSGKIGSRHGKTCCGRDERCDKPPCTDDGACVR